MVELSIIPNVNMKFKQFLQDSKQNVVAILAVLKNTEGCSPYYKIVTVNLLATFTV